ncbi:MAG: hypothetical protein KGZ96_08840 [Clostridia bacterium]|jgi:hypothetical protein|nr:hypothetical protein [Clostridia bacterium]
MEKLGKITDYTDLIEQTVTEETDAGAEKVSKVAATGYVVLLGAAFFLNLLVVVSIFGLMILAGLNII